MDRGYWCFFCNGSSWELLSLLRLGQQSVIWVPFLDHSHLPGLAQGGCPAQQPFAAHFLKHKLSLALYKVDTSVWLQCLPTQ
jgi:hypothetical protein